MATRLIEQEDVSKACNDLIRAGEEPSTIKVRKILGKGSHSTIQKFIKTWKESEDGKAVQVDLLPAVVDLPPEFKEGADIFIKQIFKLAEDQHMAVAEQIKQSCDQAVAVAHAEVREAVDYVETVDQENADLKESLEFLGKEKTGLLAEKGSLEKQVTELTFKGQNLQDEVKRKEKGLSDLQKIVANVEGQVVTQTNLVTKANNTIAGLQKEIDLMKKAAEKQDGLLKSATGQINNLQGEAKVAAQQATNDKAIITDIKDRLASMSTEHQSEIESIKEGYRTSIAELKISQTTAVTDLKEQIAAESRRVDITRQDWKDDVADLKKSHEVELGKKDTKMFDLVDEHRTSNLQIRDENLRFAESVEKLTDELHTEKLSCAEKLSEIQTVAAEEKGLLAGELTSVKEQLGNQRLLQERIVALEAEVGSGADKNNALAEQIKELENQLKKKARSKKQ